VAAGRCCRGGAELWRGVRERPAVPSLLVAAGRYVLPSPPPPPHGAARCPPQPEARGGARVARAALRGAGVLLSRGPGAALESVSRRCRDRCDRCAVPVGGIVSLLELTGARSRAGRGRGDPEAVGRGLGPPAPGSQAGWAAVCGAGAELGAVLLPPSVHLLLCFFWVR